VQKSVGLPSRISNERYITTLYNSSIYIDKSLKLKKSNNMLVGKRNTKTVITNIAVPGDYIVKEQNIRIWH